MNHPRQTTLSHRLRAALGPKAMRAVDASLFRAHRLLSRSLSPRTPETDPPREGMENVLIVGAGSGGQVLAWELRDNPRWKLWPRAFVDDDPAKVGRTYAGIPVLGDSDAIPALVASE